jgi:hypothetical protein
MTREERLKLIIDTLRDAEMQLPTSKLAGRVGLKVTPYFRGLMSELMQLGIVVCEQGRLTNGLPVNLWQLSDRTRSELENGYYVQQAS